MSWPLTTETIMAFEEGERGEKRLDDYIEPVIELIARGWPISADEVNRIAYRRFMYGR